MSAVPGCSRTKSLALLIPLLSIVLTSCQSEKQPEAKPTTETAETAVDRQPGAIDEQTRAFCSGCHAIPLPESFPKSAWYDEVKRGFDFYHQSNRKDLSPPPVQPVVEYFRSRAPDTLTIPTENSSPNPNHVRFHKVQISLPRANKGSAMPAAISFVGHVVSSSGTASDVTISDMANGGIYLHRFAIQSPDSRLLMQLEHPAGLSRCDLNGNGRMDLVAADLGSFNPADHDRGRVMWLPDFEQSSVMQTPKAIIQGIGRVADIQPADFDGDGDIDLVVAEFGWHQTGKILWLRNDGNQSEPHFNPHSIDQRPGTIHVPVVDLNRDGKPDFVALISQEFEVIEAFLNQGEGTFQKQTIHQAGDPAFGSSGIQIVDLDGDGDDDVVYTNGDMFDSFLIKPYHGIQWLENTGGFPFKAHRLALFPGAHRAIVSDLDQDGDLDIIAGAFLPASARNSEVGRQLDSLIWLEQTHPGEFVRHSLETGNCIHATLDVADFDGDGDQDIAVGLFRDSGAADQAAVEIWWNQSIAK